MTNRNSLYDTGKSLLAFLFSFASITNSWAADKKPGIEKHPSWISVLPVNYTNVSMDDEAEAGYSDLLYEKQVSLVQQATYYKMAMRVLSETGVENLSQVSITYQPSFQQVVFHTIQIIRGNQVINKLELSKIKTLQQEQDLDRSIYNGSLTAVLILEDLRKDDILEYSYTIKGFNPVFNNKFSGSFLTQFGVPVYNTYYKIIAPAERNLQIKTFILLFNQTCQQLATSVYTNGNSKTASIKA